MSGLMVQILVYGLALVGGGLLVWAWFGDWWLRKRGRRPQRRCPKCWYDLTHTAGMVCSECGYEGKNERRFGKARRRKRWCGVALGMLVGSYGVLVYLGVSQRGWAAALPDWVLIANLRQMDDAPIHPSSEFFSYLSGFHMVDGVKGVVSDEFWHRARGGTFSNWEWGVLVTQAFAGDPARPPLSWQWKGFYGELLYDAIDAGAVNQGRVDEFAVAHWKVDVRVPERWLTERGFPIHLYEQRWAPYRHGRVSINWALAKGYVGSPGNDYPESSNSQQKGGGRTWWSRPTSSSMAPDQHRFEFECQVEGVSLEKAVVFDAPKPTPTLIGDMLGGVQSPEITALLAGRVTATVGLGYGLHSIKWPAIFIDFHGLEEYFRTHDAPTVGVVVDVLRNGEIIYTCRGWAWTTKTALLSDEVAFLPQEAAQVMTNLEIEMRIPRKDPDDWYSGKSEADFTQGKWSVRLRSDAEMALLNFKCDEYWVGEVTIPLVIGK